MAKSQTAASGDTNRSFTSVILPIMTAVLVGFTIIGLALPVLPRHVHDDLKGGNILVGMVTGAQFAASLLSRFPAGSFADRRGGKAALIAGLGAAAIGGVLYLVSLFWLHQTLVSLVILLLGRAIVGAAESLMITGAMTLGLSQASPRDTGKVIAWVGTGMFAAFALGAPFGSLLFNAFGFVSIAVLSIGLPLPVLLLVLRLKGTTPKHEKGGSVAGILAGVWLPGLGAAFTSFGYAAILAFSTLVFASHHWDMGWLPVTAFALALIAARLCLGQLPDTLGSPKTAAIFAAIAAAGQAIAWWAPAPALAALGAALTGAGWALVYPALGAEAVRHGPSQNRGLIMATYSAFPDLALGVAGPALGLVANHLGLSSVYAAAAITALCTVPVALVLLRRPD